MTILLLDKKFSLSLMESNGGMDCWYKYILSSILRGIFLQSHKIEKYKGTIQPKKKREKNSNFEIFFFR